MGEQGKRYRSIKNERDEVVLAHACQRLLYIGVLVTTGLCYDTFGTAKRGLYNILETLFRRWGGRWESTAHVSSVPPLDQAKDYVLL